MRRLGIMDLEFEMMVREKGRDGIDVEWLERRDAGYLVWIDKAGNVYQLKDMTDDYVANVLKYLKKSVESIVSRRRRSDGYDPVRAEGANLSNDWSEDSNENWMPQEYLGGAFDGLF